MRTLTTFEQISLDGFFSDADGDMSWAHKHDPEWTDFVASNAGGGGALVFGRVTYDLMASYWPTPMARANDAAVATRMNELPKLVVSRSMTKATWNNTTIVRGDIAAEFARLKETPGPDMVILGSGSLVSQLTDARLIDEYQIVVNPIVLGRGRSIFAEVKERRSLTLQRSRSFANGNVVLWYRPSL